jgi:bacterioferritin
LADATAPLPWLSWQEPIHEEFDMLTRTQDKNADRQATSAPRLELDEAAIDRARQNLDDGAVTPHFGPWRDEIVRLLNGALATELVCVLRYKRHHFTAHGLNAPAVAAEFMVHANAEAGHADRIAERIVQLGGEPDFSPSTLLERSHAEYDESRELKAMIRANLVAERVAVETYRQMIQLIGDKDPTTRRLLEQVLADEEEHADEMADLLED